MRFFLFSAGGLAFQVAEQPDGTFVGYHDGEASISAPRGDVCAIGLIRKHVTGLPEGKVINLADYLISEESLGISPTS